MPLDYIDDHVKSKRGRSYPKRFLSVSDDAQFLTGPPNVIIFMSRAQIVIAAAVMAVALWYGVAYSDTTITSIYYESSILSAPNWPNYLCRNLAPKVNMKRISTENNEMAQFGASRYNFTECVATLGTHGQNLCSDQNRVDVTLSIVGISGNNGNCKSVILASNYRFCYESISETFDLTLDEASTSFVPRDTISSSLTLSTRAPTFFFTNSSGVTYFISTTFDVTDTLNENLVYTSDNVNNVYVVAYELDGTRWLYQFTLFATQAVKRFSVNPIDMNVVGLVATSSYVWVYLMSGLSPYSANLLQWPVGGGGNQATTTSINACENYIDSFSTSINKRWLAYGDDSMLYFLCTTSWKKTNSGSNIAIPVNTFFSMDPAVGTSSVAFLSINTSAIQSEIKQIIHATNKVYILTDRTYLFSAVTASQPTFHPTPAPVSPPPPPGSPPPPVPSPTAGNIVYQPVTAIQQGNSLSRTSTGAFLVRGAKNSPSFYVLGVTEPVNGVAPQYPLTYLTFTMGSATFTSTTLLNYYTGYYLRKGYHIGICNEVVNSMPVDYSDATYFSDNICTSQGYYYQTSTYLQIPSTCNGIIDSISTATATSKLAVVSACSDVSTLYSTYVTSTCSSAINTICDISWKNPPFQCTNIIKATPLSIVANAFSYASTAWTFMVVFSSKVLSIVYPDGFHLDYEHDKLSKKDDKDVDRDSVSVNPKAGSMNHQIKATTVVPDSVQP